MDNSPYYDWTGLVSGHIKPKAVEQAHTAQLSAWADYQEACDNEGVLPLPRLRVRAKAADREYNRIYNTWQFSMGECTCRPDRDACPTCKARHELDGDEMPY